MNLRSLATCGLQPHCFGRLHTHRYWSPLQDSHLCAPGCSRLPGFSVKGTKSVLSSLVVLKNGGACHRNRTDIPVLARRNSAVKIGRRIGPYKLRMHLCPSVSGGLSRCRSGSIITTECRHQMFGYGPNIWNDCRHRPQTFCSLAGH